MYGYWNKVLNVDLAKGTVQVEPLDSEIAAKFIGGVGYSSKVIYDQVGANVDPLGPDNIILFSTGPLTGIVPCSGRLSVNTKSPKNRLITMSDVGGRLGVALKQAGYDVLIVRNSSTEPVYIWIDDDKVEVRKADALWGKNVYDTSDSLRRQLGEKSEHEIKVAAIGPGGENQVKFASLVSEYFHAAGRGGTGAVMGSKKLKAVAVRGTKKVAVANPTELERAGREAADRMRNLWYPTVKAEARPDWHYWLDERTAEYQDGVFGIKNYQTTVLPGWLENNTSAQGKKYSVRPLPTCYHCPTPCYWEVEVTDGKYAGMKLGGFHFYSVVQFFGGLCGILGLPALWKCKEACQKLGIDYWSAGSVLAFAMELYQRGIITKADTGGIDLNWGDDDAALQMLEQIAYRRGVGDILAEGIAAAAKKMGKDAMKYAYTIKGDEMIPTDPRIWAMPRRRSFWFVGMLDSNRGGDNIKTAHCHWDETARLEAKAARAGMSLQEYMSKFVPWLDIFEDEKRQIFGVPPKVPAAEGQVALTKWSGDLCAMLGSLTSCIFTWSHGGTAGPTLNARMLSACTGTEVTPAHLMKTGERIFNLQRMYLLKCGFSSKDDDFPAKFYEAIPDGPAKGTRLLREDIDKVRQEYYRLRGWSKKGVPSAKKLRDLGLID